MRKPDHGHFRLLEDHAQATQHRLGSRRIVHQQSCQTLALLDIRLKRQDVHSALRQSEEARPQRPWLVCNRYREFLHLRHAIPTPWTPARGNSAAASIILFQRCSSQPQPKRPRICAAPKTKRRAIARRFDGLKYFPGWTTECRMNVPSCNSATAWRSCSCVFMTIGPYQATGSSIGLPDTSRNRIPSGPACTVISSPRSNSTSEWFATSYTGAAFGSSPDSVSTACGSDASRNVPDPANTYANAFRVVSTFSRFRLPGATETSM